jgi:Cu(I)/Ag(I) efflux system membrane fusion protein/cobalt-zinc-cadmium efflux system membrane fusion protein
VLGLEGQDGLVQVTGGISAGEEVVTSAQFLMDSESRMKEAIQKMLKDRLK